MVRNSPSAPGSHRSLHPRRPTAEGLAEHKIRDLNDQINKLLREKYHWERRIRELGGADHRVRAASLERTRPPTALSAGAWSPGCSWATQKSAPREDGDALEAAPGKGGTYRYFGAAKNLPGVKELFERQTKERAKRTRAEIMRGLDADYYGYRDDDDGLLERLEGEVEEKARRAAAESWEGGTESAPGADAAPGDGFLAHVPLPSDEEIKRKVLEKRKRELIERYLE